MEITGSYILIDTSDPIVWAESFLEAYPDCGVPLGDVFKWFSSAIQAGWDGCELDYDLEPECPFDCDGCHSD